MQIGLKIRHHQSGRYSFSGYISHTNKKFKINKSQVIIIISPYFPMRQIGSKDFYIPIFGKITRKKHSLHFCSKFHFLFNTHLGNLFFGQIFIFYGHSNDIGQRLYKRNQFINHNLSLRNPHQNKSQSFIFMCNRNDQFKFLQCILFIFFRFPDFLNMNEIILHIKIVTQRLSTIIYSTFPFLIINKKCQFINLQLLAKHILENTKNLTSRKI